MKRSQFARIPAGAEGPLSARTVVKGQGGQDVPLITPDSPASPIAQWMWFRAMTFKPSFSAAAEDRVSGERKCKV